MLVLICFIYVLCLYIFINIIRLLVWLDSCIFNCYFNMADIDVITKAFEDNPKLNVKEIACLLGISRNTLYKRMRLYSIKSGRDAGRPIGSLKPLVSR